MTGPGLFRRLAARFTSSNDDLVAEELSRQSMSQGAMLCGNAGLRDEITILGTISSLTLSPKDDHPRLEADISDGSGTVVLIWMGRRTIRGIEVGRTLRVRGRLTSSRGTTGDLQPLLRADPRLTDPVRPIRPDGIRSSSRAGRRAWRLGGPARGRS